jgi:hypothetical protein
MKDLRPVCFSGLDYLIRHAVDRIVVVTPPNSVLVDIIHLYYSHQRLQFIYQAEPLGVGAALNACDLEPDISSKAMVVMADNVYPKDETIPAEDLKLSWPFVVTRDVPAWRATHLVKAETGSSLQRKEGSGSRVLSTPWVINACNFATNEGWPDLSGTRRCLLPGKGWWDIGTAATYEAYWRSDE